VSSWHHFSTGTLGKRTMRMAIPDKLSFVLLVWICAFLLPWQWNSAVIGFVIILQVLAPSFRPISKSSRRYFSRFVAYALVLTLVLALVNGLLIREGSVRFSILFLNFFDAGIIYGLEVSVRIVLLSLSILLFFGSTRIQDFARYLQSVGMPNSFVSILLLTLHFLEQLPHRIAQIFTAQEARGAPVRAGILSRGRALLLVLPPLILSSIVESLERGAALELRGYHFYKPVTIDGKDTRFSLWRYVFMTLAITVIIRSVYLWLMR